MFQVLVLDKNNSKALYRRAQGKLGLKEYDSALTDLNNALNYCPNDRNIQSKIDTTKKDKLKYLKIEREVCSKIFQWIGSIIIFSCPFWILIYTFLFMYTKRGIQ